MPKMSKTGKQFSELSKQQEKTIASFSTSVDGLNESVSKLTDIMISNNIQKKLAGKANKKAPKKISKGATKDKKTTSPFSNVMSESAAESFGQGNILAGLIGSVLSIPEILNERSKLKTKLAQKKIDQIEAQKVRELRKSSTKVEKTKTKTTSIDAAKVDEKYDLVDTLDKLEGAKKVVADVPQLIETNKKIDDIYQFLIKQPTAPGASSGSGVGLPGGGAGITRMGGAVGRGLLSIAPPVAAAVTAPATLAVTAAAVIGTTAYLATEQNNADVTKASDEKDITDKPILDSGRTDAEKLAALTANARGLALAEHKQAALGGEAAITYDPNSAARIAKETLQDYNDKKAREKFGNTLQVKTEQLEEWIKYDEVRLKDEKLSYNSRKDIQKRIDHNKAILGGRTTPPPPTLVPPAKPAIMEAPVDILQPPPIPAPPTAVPPVPPTKPAFAEAQAPAIPAPPTPVPPTKPATPQSNTSAPVRLPSPSRELGLNFSKLSPAAKKNAELIAGTLKDKGYNTELIAAVLGKVQTEVGPKLAPVSEKSYENTEVKSIRDKFGITKKDGTKNAIAQMSDAEIDKLKKDPEKFFNTVYGKDSLKVLGNTEEGDGYKYRGRGYIQVTGRDNYARLSKKLYGNEKTLLDNPDLLNKPEDSARAMASYLGDVVPRLEKVSGLSSITGTPQEKSELVASAIAAGGGQRRYTAEGGIIDFDRSGNVVRSKTAPDNHIAKLVRNTITGAAEFLNPVNNKGAETYAASIRVEEAKGSPVVVSTNTSTQNIQNNTSTSPSAKRSIPTMKDSSADGANKAARS